MKSIRILQNGMRALVYAEELHEFFTRNDCAFVFSETTFYREVSPVSAVRMHPPKHPDKGLAPYLLPQDPTQRGGIEAVFAHFSATGRLYQSIQALLDQAHNKDYPSTMLVGVSDELFTRLCREGLKEIHLSGQPTAEPATYSVAHLADASEHMATIRKHFHGTNLEADRVRMQILEATASELPVLVLGETGTGKEVVAHLIHNLSRSGKPFFPVNCGAIPITLFESVLFGHAPHAFADAGNRYREGLWELANDGTLFLDEIGDLPLDAQVKILRALESGKILPVRGEKEIPVHARVIAATHRDLHRMVELGTFREDLFYRLRLFVIRTPSLADNGEHLEAVIRECWAKVHKGNGPKLSKRVVALLAKRTWVGNYRDLKNFLRALWDHINCCQESEVLPLHVKAIEERYGPSPKAPDDPLGGALDQEVRRMRYMHHHAMCAEALRTLQMTVEPLTQRGKNAPDNLELRLRHGVAELALLLSKPHRFRDPPTFHTIDNARAAAQTLLERVFTPPGKRRALAKRETLPAIKKGLDATFNGT